MNKSVDIIVVPKNEDWKADIDLRVAHGMKEGQALGFIKSSDLIIIITGWSKGIRHSYFCLRGRKEEAY